MSKSKSAVKASTREEAIMYTLLLLGVSAIVALFAVNIMLIDKIFENVVVENVYLRQTLINSNNQRSNGLDQEFEYEEETGDMLGEFDYYFDEEDEFTDTMYLDDLELPVE